MAPPSVNRLALAVVSGERGRASPRIAILIDGQPLLDLAAEAERDCIARGARKNVTGGYAPLDARWSKGIATSGETGVLGCSCGEFGCWPLLVTVAFEGQLVVWDRFRNPFMPDWDYRNLGPFTFDRDQYFAEYARIHGAE